MISLFNHDVSLLTPAVKRGRLASASNTGHLSIMAEKSLQNMLLIGVI